MKKFILATLLTAAAVSSSVFFCGCNKKTDYFSYISEKRTNIFVYCDDTVEVKVQCSVKEQPFAADGYCGETNSFAEVSVSLPKNPQKLEVSVEGNEGEMNYQAVENLYTLSFSAPEFTADRVDVTITYDGESRTYTALSVKHGSVLSCEQAVQCVIERDGELFKNLTYDGLFNGEIFVRLLYDDGCYYYVGVCDKNKHISAYLIDGERGTVIATKDLQT